MINSRSITDLHPEFRKLCISFIADYEMETGLKLLITCTLRDNLAQEALYEQGRTKPGHIVTNAKPGSSFHNYGLAMDAYPMISGKPLFQATDSHGNLLKEWADFGRIAKRHGLAWAGDWTGSLREYAHVQAANVTLAQLQKGTQIA